MHSQYTAHDLPYDLRQRIGDAINLVLQEHPEHAAAVAATLRTVIEAIEEAPSFRGRLERGLEEVMLPCGDDAPATYEDHCAGMAIVLTGVAQALRPDSALREKVDLDLLGARVWKLSVTLWGEEMSADEEGRKWLRGIGALEEATGEEGKQ